MKGYGRGRLRSAGEGFEQGKTEQPDRQPHAAETGPVYIDAGIIGKSGVAVSISQTERKRQQNIHGPVEIVKMRPAKDRDDKGKAADCDEQVILANLFLFFIMRIFFFWVDLFL